MFTTNTKSGYTLLFATIVAALVLGVAAFTTNIVRKQYILSSTAVNSTYSFYATDSAIECAAAAYTNGTLSSSTQASISCNGHTYEPIDWTSGLANGVDISDGFSGNLSKISALGISLQNGSKYNCALISVRDGLNVDGSAQTVIDVQGYNLAGNLTFTSNSPSLILGSCPQTSPRTIERALRLVYYK